MPFTLRKENDSENPTLAVPYGHQITLGRLVYYDKENGRTKFISILGQGVMDGIDRVYMAGDIITEFDASGNRQWMFHPGTLSTGFSDPVQGRPYFFPELDVTFSGIAYIEVLLPTERSTDEDEPSEMKFFVRGRRVQDYTVSGGNLVPNGSPIFSANNALVAADIITSFMGLPLSRIDGAAWLAFKNRCDEVITWQATNAGFTGQYFSDTNLSVPAFLRTDATIDFNFDYTTPSPSINNSFSVRWTGKIKPQFSETYTFYTTTDDGARLWVNGVQLVNDWAAGGVRQNSGTIALTAGQEYDVTYEYWQLGGPGEVKFEWQSTSTPRAVVPKDVINSTARAIPRYEAHIVFPQEVMATTALDAVMYNAPGCNWQDVNGKIRFITVPNYVDLTDGVTSLPAGGRALSYSFVYDSTQTIKKANIVQDSFSAFRKSPSDKPNFLRAVFRNLNDEYYRNGYSFADRRALRAQAKGLVDPGLSNWGVMSQSQADRILETQMRVASDLDLYVNVKGQYKALELAKGDIVRLSHNVPGWRETAPPLFMVVDETFEPTVGSSASADERSFTLQIYSPEFYSDTSHGPVAGLVTSSLTANFSAPPLAVDLILSEGSRILPDGTVLSSIDGTVEVADFPYPQIVQIWVKRPSAVDYIFTNIVLAPDPITRTASFSLDSVEGGIHYVRAVTSSTTGVSKLPRESHLTEAITITGTALPAPNPPATLTGSFDASTGLVKWSWPHSTSLGVDLYELRKTDGTVIYSGFSTTFYEPDTNANMVRRVYSHNLSGLYSTTYAESSYSPLGPSAVAGYDFTRYKTSFIHTFSANSDSERISYYEISRNSSFTDIVWKGEGTRAEETIPTPYTTRTYSRYIRAVGLNGRVSTTTTVTKTFAAPVAPTLSIDRDYPSSKEININSAELAATITDTVIEISTATGGGFNAGIIEDRVLEGKQDSATINGQVVQNATLYVKVYFRDVFTTALNDPNKSADLTCTFTQFVTGDILDAAITNAKLALNSVSAGNIAAGAVGIAKFAAGIEPVTLVTSVPGTLSTQTIFNTTDKKLYKWNGTAYVVATPTAFSDLTGTIVAAQIADASLTTAKFAAGIEPVTLVTSVPGTLLTQTIYNTTDKKLYKWNGTAYVAAAPTTFAELSGTVVTAQIADAALTTAKFAAGIEPVTVVSSVPGTFVTQTIYNTTDKKLYKWNGTAYVVAAPTSFAELAGTITAAQFAATIEPVTLVTSVPGTLSTQTIYNTTDKKLYKWNGTAYVAATVTSFSELTGTVTTAQIADAALTTAKFAAGIEPITIVTSVPGSLSTKTIFNTTDGKLYKWNGTAYVVATPTTFADLTGTVTAAQIADASITTAKFAAGIEPITIVTSVPGTLSTKTIFNTTDGKLYKWNGSAYVVATPTAFADLTGTVTSAQIADASLTTAKFAASIEPITIVTSVPGTLSTKTIFNTTDGKLYKWNGTAYVVAAPTAFSELTGAITTTQITDNSITTAKIAANAITAAQIAADTITAGQIAAGAINTSELAAGAVTAAKIAAGTITANEIAAATITAVQIAASTITGANIAAGTITAANIAADTITAGQIAAGAISTSELAAGAVTAAKIAAGTITANEIAALTITASQIAASTITGNKIAANTITAANIAADTITAGEIAAGAISTSELAAGAVTAAKIAAGTITANEIAALTITAAQIAAGTITGAKIAAGTITATNLAADTITAGQIAAGAIGASEIAAGAITTDKLLVGNFDNLCDDPGFERGSPAWTSVQLVGSQTFTIQGANAASGALAGQFAWGSGTASSELVNDIKLDCVPGDVFYISGKVRTASGAGGTAGVRMKWYTSAGVFISDSDITIAATPAGTFYTASGSVTAPATAVFAKPAFVVLNQTSLQWQVDDMNVRRVVDSVVIADGAVTAAKIAAGTITAAQIATDTITAGQIAAGAINTSELAAGAVTAAKIAAGTITANEIASLTITAVQIAAATITGNKIAANTITAANIAADTITAGEIAAGAISTSELAAGAVTAIKIAAGTITSNEIAANTILAGNIAAATITGAKLAAGTITAANIATDTITAGQIAAGAIGASEIAAGAVTTGKLVVGNFDNLVEDPGFERGAGAWTESQISGFSSTALDPASHSGASGTKIQYGSGTASIELVNLIKLDCKPGDKFYIEGWVNTANGAGGTAGVRLKWYNASNVLISNSDVTTTALPAGTWALAANSFIAPANAVYVKPAFVVLNQTAWQWYVDDMYLRRVVDSAIIADAAIITAKIADAAIVNAKIADATILNAKIADATIQGAKIADATITNAKIQSLGVDKLIAATAEVGLVLPDVIRSRDYIPYSGSTYNQVTWTNVSGVSITGTDNKLTKTATNGWGTGGAWSVESFAGDCWVEDTITSPSSTNNGIIGLGVADSSTSYTDVDYGLMTSPDGLLYIFESGTQRGTTYGTWAVGGKRKIERIGTQVKYYYNGSLIYTSGLPSTGTLHVDTALYFLGETISNVVFSNNFARGWMFEPSRGSTNPGALQINGDGTSTGANMIIRGRPVTELNARVFTAIDNHGYLRGPDTGVVPLNDINLAMQLYAYIEEFDTDGGNDRASAAIGVNIDAYRDDSGYANGATIDSAEISIKNKFGETTGGFPVRYRPFSGQGIVFDGRFDRKYTDPVEEATFVVRIHNLFGYSAPMYISFNQAFKGTWGGNNFSTSTPPSYSSKQSCPLDLTASASGPDTIVLNWSPATSNTNNQNVQMRVKGANNRWSGWSTIAGSLAYTIRTFTWTGANPFTQYEFQIQCQAFGISSNIAYCLTQPNAVVVSRPAPSGIVGSARNSTTVDWNWSRNASDNTDVEYSLNGGGWTATGSAGTTSLTTTVSAGSTNTLRVRNKWSSGTTYSAEASSNGVTTPVVAPVSTDPSNLTATTPTRYAILASWTNNGSVNQTLEYKLHSSGSWTSVSLGAVSSYNITSLIDDTFYDVRVRATSGSNYTGPITVSTQQGPSTDPYDGCVLLDMEVTMSDGSLQLAGKCAVGDVILTGKLNHTRIKRVILGKTDTLYIVHTSSGKEVRCSPSQPFPTDLEESRTMRTDQLSKGTFIKVVDNYGTRMERISSIEVLDAAMPVVIFELEHSDHTFVAGGIVLHNISQK